MTPSTTVTSRRRRRRLRPASVRWTHIALPCTDIDATIEWYETFTPLELLDRREDADGQGAWLGHPDQGDKPFILVLVSFFRDQDKGPQPIMAPFAHIGIEMPTKEMVDASPHVARTPAACSGRRSRCPTPSATSARSPTPTAT